MALFYSRKLAAGYTEMETDLAKQYCMNTISFLLVNSLLGLNTAFLRNTILTVEMWVAGSLVQRPIPPFPFPHLVPASFSANFAKVQWHSPHCVTYLVYFIDFKIFLSVKHSIFNE